MLPQNVINQFTELGRDPRVRFMGNVRAGTDVPLSSLRTMYSAVRSSPGLFF